MTKKNADKVRRWIHKLDGQNPMQPDLGQALEQNLSDEAYNNMITEIETKIDEKQPEITKEFEIALIKIASQLPTGNAYKEAIDKVKEK